MYLYRERTFLDAAYYLFHLIQEKRFIVEHQRYVLAISQVLPLVAVWLKLPLKWVMMVFSLNQAVFSGLIAWWIDRMYQRKAGAVLPVFIVAFAQVYYLYYCPLYEIWYGAFLLLLLWAMMDSGWLNAKSARIYWVFPISFLIFTAHPSLLYAFPMIVFYAYQQWPKHVCKQWMISISMALVAWLLLKIFFISAYERAIIARDISPALRWQHMQNPVFLADLWKLFREHYVFTDVLFVIAIGGMVIRKAWFEIVFFMAWVVGYLVFTAYANDATTGMFIPFNERVFTVMVSMVACVAWKNIPPSVENVMFGLVCLGTIISFIPTIQHRTFYAHRIEVIDAWIQDQGKPAGSRIYTDFKKLPQADVFDEWSIQMEILLHSSLQGKTYYVTQMDWMQQPENASHTQNGYIHLRFNEWIPVKKLNTDYFVVPIQ